MRSFIYNSHPSRVVFGVGRISDLPQEVQALGLSRVVVLSTPGQKTLAADLEKSLGPLCAGIYPHAVMHVPEDVARAAVLHVKTLGADGLVAAGGGSTTGLAKAIALETGLPILAVPTTYAGSEMTSIWGLTKDGVKTTGRDARVLPKTVIYDPALTIRLPADIVATSGMNAIAHCVEAMYAQDQNPVTSMMAEAGINALAHSLPRIVQDPTDAGAREEALYGAWLSGIVLGAVGMALHHKLCHTLGGSFNLPHAGVHTVMIPYVTAFNSSAAESAMLAISRALGSEDAAGGLWDLNRQLDVPCALGQIGMHEKDLDAAAELATLKPYWNPRPVTRDAIRELLQNAFEGNRPK
jgi:maleylacetate reductase